MNPSFAQKTTHVSVVMPTWREFTKEMIGQARGKRHTQIKET